MRSKVGLPVRLTRWQETGRSDKSYLGAVENVG
jgi:hypothetical protein